MGNLQTTDELPPAFGSEAWEDAWRAAYLDHHKNPSTRIDVPEPPSGTEALVRDGEYVPGYTKFTAVRVAYILEILRRGHPQTTAAALAGVCYRTLQRWKRLGRLAAEAIEDGEPDPPDLEEMSEEEKRRHLAFYRHVEMARAAAQYRDEERLKEVGYDPEGDWRALKELMERREDGPVERTEVEAGGGDTINIAIRIDGGPPEGAGHEPSGGRTIEVGSGG